MAAAGRGHGGGGAGQRGVRQFGAVGVAGRLVGDGAQAEALAGVGAGRAQPAVVEGKAFRDAVFEKQLAVVGAAQAGIQGGLDAALGERGAGEEEIVCDGLGTHGGLRHGKIRLRQHSRSWRRAPPRCET